MNDKEQCFLIMEELNFSLSESCLDKRINNTYPSEQVHKFVDNINYMLTICEKAMTRANRSRK